jgi:nucleoid DNA-binding protein
MNKSELIQAVASELKGSKTDAQKIVDTVLDCIKTGLKSDEKVNISGFGTFVKRTRGPRKGVSPVTKQPIDIPPTTSCGFKPSQQLREQI